MPSTPKKWTCRFFERKGIWRSVIVATPTLLTTHTHTHISLYILLNEPPGSHSKISNLPQWRHLLLFCWYRPGRTNTHKLSAVCTYNKWNAREGNQIIEIQSHQQIGVKTGRAPWTFIPFVVAGKTKRQQPEYDIRSLFWGCTSSNMPQGWYCTMLFGRLYDRAKNRSSVDISIHGLQPHFLAAKAVSSWSLPRSGTHTGKQYEHYL